MISEYNPHKLLSKVFALSDMVGYKHIIYIEHKKIK